MKRIFQLLLISFLPLSLVAQDETGTLKGNVSDDTNDETLVGATILIVGTYKATSSDFVGDFEMEGIKPGDYSIKISYIGYAEKIFNGIRI